MNTAIYHPGNAGLYFYGRGTGILVDGIYGGRGVGMSEMNEAWERELCAGTGIFSHVSALVYTHLHPDHFQPEKAAFYMEEHPQTLRYAPEWDQSNVWKTVQNDRMERILIDQAELVTMKTIHDGEVFRADPHESLLLKMENEIFFIAGDAELFAEDAGEVQKIADHVDAAFVNLYQLGGDTGMEFLKLLNPDRIFLYHLPEAEDDDWNYRVMAKQALKRAKKQAGLTAEVLRHMAWVDGKEAIWNAKPESLSKPLQNAADGNR